MQTNNITKSKRWLAPLLHLFILSFVTFGLHAILNRETKQVKNDPFLIEVTSAKLDWFQTMWTKRMGRLPDAQEIRGQIDQLIREQILEREARRMGLDQDDTIVRRRLSQKMDFLFQDLGSSVEPNESQLRNYYAKHQDRYATPGHVTFTQVFFNGDQRGMEQAFVDANELLAQWQTSAPTQAELETVGDRSLLPSSGQEQTTRAIENQFGKAFQIATEEAPLQQWSGPVDSSFGQHLVFVHARTNSPIPELETILATVSADWLSEQQRLSKQRHPHRFAARHQWIGPYCDGRVDSCNLCRRYVLSSGLTSYGASGNHCARNNNRSAKKRCPLLLACCRLLALCSLHSLGLVHQLTSAYTSTWHSRLRCGSNHGGAQVTCWVKAIG
ncbi:peptidylprolyl isomerase [Planctomycetota bacterium]